MTIRKGVLLLAGLCLFSCGGGDETPIAGDDGIVTDSAWQDDSAAGIDLPGTGEVSSDVPSDVPADAVVQDLPVETDFPSPETPDADCVPLTCVALGKECGTWGDGCGASMKCPECPAGQFCTQDGSCDELNVCSPVIFELTDLALGGLDNRVEVQPGATVLAIASWRINNDGDCPGCDRQVVFGVEEDSQGCIDAGNPETCPLVSEGFGNTTLEAPLAPGTYNVYAAAPEAAGCASAAVQYEAGIPKAAVGVIQVLGDCTPQTCPEVECTLVDCPGLGKECETWGDGCGAPVDCGQCPPGQECDLHGHCTGPCTLGMATLDLVHLNGGGPVASSAPGLDVVFDFQLAVSNPDGCSGCSRQVVVGFGSQPGFCQELVTPPACPDFRVDGIAGSLDAPGTPGTYTMYAAVTTADDCDAAYGLFQGTETKGTLGILKVHAGCVPDSCGFLAKDCGPVADGCGFELDCGGCPLGDTCTTQGHCDCSADDPYEPNDAASAAHDLGTFSDSDAVSSQTHTASLLDESDWYTARGVDQIMAIMAPYVSVETALSIPFEVQVAFLCDDGSVPVWDVQPESNCQPGGMVDLSSVPGVGSEVQGFTCSGAGGPVIVSFGPLCPTTDDSGQLYIGVLSDGPCSSYVLDMHF